MAASPLRRLAPSALLVAPILLVAVAVPLLPLHDPVRQDIAGHWFGQDEYGRDVPSRPLRGARVSLSVAVATSLAAGVVGTLLGLLGGYFRGVVEFATARVAEVALCFPPLLLALLVLNLPGPGSLTLAAALLLESGLCDARAGWVRPGESGYTPQAGTTMIRVPPSWTGDAPGRSARPAAVHPVRHREDAMIEFPRRPANPADPAPVLPWPDGTRCAVMPAFDVDAETAWLQYDPANTDRLVTLSFGGYEERVGVPKLLAYLRSVEIKATFFIPGWVVEVHPGMCEAILRDGHEVGHHGHTHKRPDPADLAEDKEEIDRALDALRRVLGVVPVGYRAPSGENYDALLAHLRDRGFLYSSSFRDDIRPYRHRQRDGSAGIVELPVNMSFDDWLYGLSQRFSPRPMFPREHVLSIWNDELDQTREWGGLVAMVMHPQVSGRPMRIGIVRDFLARARGYGDVWIATGREIAEHFVAQEASADDRPAP